MSKIRKILAIIYYCLLRPEDVLRTIEGATVLSNNLGGGAKHIWCKAYSKFATSICRRKLIYRKRC